MNQTTTPPTSQNSVLTDGATLRALCPAYVLPTEIRRHKQPGPAVQVTARPVRGVGWEGIFRDVDGRGVESAGHATETDALKAVALYAKGAAHA